MSTLQHADVNSHNVHICSTENPHATTQHQHELPKLNVLQLPEEMSTAHLSSLKTVSTVFYLELAFPSAR